MPLVERLLWQIEMRLDEPVTFAGLADACAVSPFHLSRSFRTATGLSPMSYLRARRLSVAAERLAAGEEILGTALAAHYGSHEAFTRAFAAYFGVLPSTVRAARSIDRLQLMEPLRMKKDMIVDVPAPEIRERGPFRVIGLGLDCTFEESAGIPALWQRFNAREDEVEREVAGAAYGLCCDAEAAGRFRYVAGVEVGRGATVPDGMEAVAVPGARYAVFAHSGHVSDLPRTVYTIWNKSLSDHGLSPAGSTDFERYDRRFDPATGRGGVEVWVPLA